MRATRLLMATLRINGTINKCQSDPSAPTDQYRSWIGDVQVSYWAPDHVVRQAAILKAATGQGLGDSEWGPHVLVLHWIGDPPPAEIAQSVYDLIWDRGPAHGEIKRVIESQIRTESQPSYRAARVA